VLKNFVLVGSWCIFFYKKYFANQNYTTTLRTRDIDFLVPRPASIQTKTYLPDLMKDLGFIKGFRGKEGYMILEHPELSIEFLVAEKSRGTDKPVELPKLGMNAQALRYMELLAQDTIQIKEEKLSITLPHPINFAFHKLITASRRRNKAKSLRDRQSAIKILQELMLGAEERVMKKVFDALPSKWRQTLLRELKKMDEKEVIKILSS